jgi:hypothetical protein
MMTNIHEMTAAEIDEVAGGPLFLPLLAGAVAIVGLAITAYNSGYTTGKDIAVRENNAN